MRKAEIHDMRGAWRLALGVWFVVEMAGLCPASLQAMPAQSRLVAPKYGDPTLMRIHRDATSGVENFPLITTFVPEDGWSAYTFIFWIKSVNPPPGTVYGTVLIASQLSTEEAMSYEETGEYRPSDHDVIHTAPTGWRTTPLALDGTGTWSAECLPATSTYDTPAALQGWQYGAYSLNVLTDSDLTITVAGAERNVAASNAVQRLTVRGVAADRSITVAASEADAEVYMGCCVTPLRQFHSAQLFAPLDPNMQSDNANSLTNEWNMVVLRAEIADAGASLRFQQLAFPLSSPSPAESNDTTSALWHARADGTFERRSRIAFTALAYGGLSADSTVSTWGAKLYREWLPDQLIDSIRAQDAERLR